MHMQARCWYIAVKWNKNSLKHDVILLLLLQRTFYSRCIRFLMVT